MRARRRRQLPRSYRAVVAIVRPLLLATTKHEWSGAEHLPATGGFVVTPNHLSYVDPLTFAHFLYDNGHPPFFLAKDGLFRVPVLGRLLTAAQQIPVYREGRHASKAFRAAVQAVNEGKCVPIFPEGTLTRDPGLWPMTGKTGAARVALTTRCPVVPVAQWGVQEILEPYGRRPHLFPRTLVRVAAGPPVDLSDLYDGPMDIGTLVEATDRIMAAVTGLLEQLRGETAPPVRFDLRRAGLAATGDPRPSGRLGRRGVGRRGVGRRHGIRAVDPPADDDHPDHPDQRDQPSHPDHTDRPGHPDEPTASAS